MFRKIEPDDTQSKGPGDGVLRHADGSIDFDTYRARALQARRAAMISSSTGTMEVLRTAFSSIANALSRKALRVSRHHTR